MKKKEYDAGPCPDEILTNADCIRSMSDEDLLDFLQRAVSNAYMCKLLRTEPMFLTIEWLKQPANENTKSYGSH